MTVVYFDTARAAQHCSARLRHAEATLRGLMWGIESRKDVRLDVGAKALARLADLLARFEAASISPEDFEREALDLAKLADLFAQEVEAAAAFPNCR